MSPNRFEPPQPLAWLKVETPRWGLSLKLTLAYSLLSALMAGTLSAGLYWQLKQAQLEAMRDRLQDTLSLAAPQIDGDYHALIFSEADESTPYFTINQQRLQSLQALNPNLHRIATLRRDKSGTFRVVHDLQQTEAQAEQVQMPPPMHHAFSLTDADLEAQLLSLQAPFVSPNIRHTEQGEPLLYGYAPIHNRFQHQAGILLLELNAQELLEQTAQAKSLAIQTFSIAILLSMGVIWLLTQRLIVAPTIALTRATQLLASGQWSYSLPIDRGDELGILAQNFSEMSQQLKAAFLTLEQRVDERTTELSVEKEKAEVASQAKSTFIATMSHELKTPLNAILGFSQILSQDVTLSEQQRKNLNTISRSGEHLLALVNDILEMSRAEAGQTHVNIHLFDLRLLLEGLYDIMQLKASEKHLNLRFYGSPQLPQWIETDERKLRQVLLNLLGNALKFTQEGEVSLTISPVICEAMIPRLQFCIRDTGEGIAPEEMGGLFDPFTQTRSGRSSQEGTGLGLSISQSFVELLGGSIVIESCLVQGTEVTFQIQIPPIPVEDSLPKPWTLSTTEQASLSRQTQDDLAQLPEALRQAINQAAQELDEDSLGQSITQLRDKAPDLAYQLAIHLDALKFDEIMELTAAPSPKPRQPTDN